MPCWRPASCSLSRCLAWRCCPPGWRKYLPARSFPAGVPEVLQRASHGPAAGASRSGAGARWQADAVVTFALQLAATVAFGVAQEVASFVQGFVSEGLADRELAVPLWIPVACSLVAGMVLAARWRGRTEWAPVAALAMAGLASGSMGAWPLAVMLLLGSGYWAARGAFSAGTARGRHVLGARVALTLAVPVTVAAVIGQGPGRDEASAFALLLALVCQQLLTAALQRSGVAAFAPQATLGAFGSAGALVLIGLPFLEAAPDHALTAVALMVQLLVAFGVGAMLLPRPAAEKDWSATRGKQCRLRCPWLLLPSLSSRSRRVPGTWRCSSWSPIW